MGGGGLGEAPELIGGLAMGAVAPDGGLAGEGADGIAEDVAGAIGRGTGGGRGAEAATPGVCDVDGVVPAGAGVGVAEAAEVDAGPGDADAEACAIPANPFAMLSGVNPFAIACAASACALASKDNLAFSCASALNLATSAWCSIASLLFAIV